MPKGDAELGREMKMGRDDAYTEVVSRFSRPVYSICLKLLRNPADAQDAAQEVFLRMFKGIASYDDSRPLNSWLFRITYNKCIDLLKSRGRNIEIPSDDIEVSVDDEPLPAEGLDAKVIWGALDNLPEHLSFILLMKYRFGLTNVEIAKVLDINENNLRVRLFRAKHLLRESLRDYKA